MLNCAANHFIRGLNYQDAVKWAIDFNLLHPSTAFVAFEKIAAIDQSKECQLIPIALNSAR
jgi:hypothetical protein